MAYARYKWQRLASRRERLRQRVARAARLPSILPNREDNRII